MDFEIDFERKRLVGKVQLEMESRTDEGVDVVLDSRYVAIKIGLSREGGLTEEGEKKIGGWTVEKTREKRD